VASVRAPFVAGQGYAWAPLSREAPAADIAAAANETAIALLEWLDTTQSTSVGLLGFSQGGALAMQLLRHAPERFAFAVNLSGFAVPDDNPRDADLAQARPPVFWGRGTLDQVITPEMIAYTESWLPRHSDLTARIYEGLQHSISRPELDDANAFMRTAWSA
jgi:phospholipase/carboxylesterase